MVSTAPLNKPASYHAPSGVYDELGHGQLPDHWRLLIEYFQNQPVPTSPEQLRRDVFIRDVDIERPWPLDPLPFVLPLDEWQLLERGLLQRAKLLNQLTADLYDRRSLLGVGGLPPALVFGNPRYLLPLSGYSTIDGQYLDLIGFDLGRSADGRWRVLADWTEAPEGFGMCLENRVFTGRALPELFTLNQTQRLADFYNGFARELHQKSERINNGIPVILSPGPTHVNYFEHVYLGQYLGWPVVEGADLTVRGTTVQMKTLEGLKPVGAVWRCMDSVLCDPLYLDPLSNDGVAGIVNIVRNKQTHATNAIGSGVLENDAFMSFLPGLCQRILGEELILPSIATWWCGQADAQDFVANQRNNLQVLSAFQRQPRTSVSDYQQASLSAHGELGYTQVAREPIQLSHAPYFDNDGAIHNGPCILRLFVGFIGGQYFLLPGGVARVATPQGELSKDIWVSEGTLAPPVFVQQESTSTQPMRSDRDLPSRTADDLFWLGRYLERSAGAVRTYRSLFLRVAEQDPEDQQLTVSTLLNLLTDLDMLSPAESRQLLRRAPLLSDLEWSRILFAQDGSDGIFSLQHRIYQLAQQVRERLSGDAWRLFSALSESAGQANVRNAAEAVSYLDRQNERLSALSGQIQENMTRSYGWRLLQLGRCLERGHFGLRVMRELVAEGRADTYLHLILDLCDSAITYRARYQNIPTLGNTLHLLLLDEANPRSTIYQVAQLREVMEHMPLDVSGDGLSESQRMLLSAYHELTLSDPRKLAEVISKSGNRTQLRRVLQRLETTMTSLSQVVTETYFAHTSNSGRLR